MARIAGIDLPRDKKVEIGLTYIYGIGRETARRIVETTGVSSALRIRDLTDADVNKLRQEIEKTYRVEGALRTEIAMNIKPFAGSAHTRTPARRRARAARSPARRR